MRFCFNQLDKIPALEEGASPVRRDQQADTPLTSRTLYAMRQKARVIIHNSRKLIVTINNRIILHRVTT